MLRYLAPQKAKTESIQRTSPGTCTRFILRTLRRTQPTSTFLHLADCQENEQSSYTNWVKVLEAGFMTAPDTKFV